MSDDDDNGHPITRRVVTATVVANNKGGSAGALRREIEKLKEVCICFISPVAHLTTEKEKEQRHKEALITHRHFIREIGALRRQIERSVSDNKDLRHEAENLQRQLQANMHNKTVLVSTMVDLLYNSRRDLLYLITITGQIPLG